MICAACERLLTPVTIRGVTVDVCQEGCAGIWFDNFELRKFDEPHEAAGQILDFTPVQPAPIDRARKRICPRCGDSVLMRHFFSFKRQFEIDVCPGCGGCWLDGGELALVRSEFKTEAEKRKATSDFVAREFGPQLHEMRIASQGTLYRAQAIASVFRAVGAPVDS